MASAASSVATAVAAAKESLVKYDAPTVFSGKGKHPKAHMPVLDGKTPLPARQEILNAIIPPREYTHDGLLWVQYSSSTPATKMDVRTLQVSSRGRGQEDACSARGVRMDRGPRPCTTSLAKKSRVDEGFFARSWLSHTPCRNNWT